MWQSQEYRLKISQKRGKKIICLNNNIIYDCSRLAAEDLDLNSRSIRRVAQGKRRTYKGYRFRYV